MFFIFLNNLFTLYLSPIKALISLYLNVSGSLNKLGMWENII